MKQILESAESVEADATADKAILEATKKELAEYVGYED
jgi:hypothetical protein